MYVCMSVCTMQELEQRDDDPLKKLKEQQKGMVTCRICKGDHWTTKCPYKDTLGPTTIKELEDSAKPKPADTAAAVVASGVTGRPAPGGGATAGGKYVPPNQRGGPEGRRGDAMGSRYNNRDGVFQKKGFKHFSLSFSFFCSQMTSALFE